MDKVRFVNLFIPIFEQNNVHGQCTGISWKVYRLITSMDSLDHCQWMMSMESVDNVPGLPGHCPWTKSAVFFFIPILKQNNIHGQ